MQRGVVTNLRVVHALVALTAAIAIDHLVILVTVATKVTANHVVDANLIVLGVLTLALALALAHVLQNVIQVVRGVTTEPRNPLSPQVRPLRGAAYCLERTRRNDGVH